MEQFTRKERAEIIHIRKIDFELFISHPLPKVPDYGPEQFLSDVGGAAGLVLGMSLTSVIGLLGAETKAH